MPIFLGIELECQFFGIHQYINCGVGPEGCRRFLQVLGFEEEGLSEFAPVIMPQKCSYKMQQSTRAIDKPASFITVIPEENQFGG